MLNRSCSGRERGYAATPTGCVTSQATGCDSPLARLLPRGRWIEFLPITPRRYWPGTANWQRSLRHLTQWQNESSKRDMIGHSMVGQCGFGLQLSMNCAAAQDAVSGPCRDLDEMAGPDAGGMHNLACRALSVRSAAGRALLIAVRPTAHVTCSPGYFLTRTVVLDLVSSAISSASTLALSLSSAGRLGLRPW